MNTHTLKPTPLLMTLTTNSKPKCGNSKTTSPSLTSRLSWKITTTNKIKANLKQGPKTIITKIKNLQEHPSLKEPKAPMVYEKA